MTDITLTTPLTEEVIRKLQLEDTVYINGHIYGIRDATQIRIFDEGVPPPPTSPARSACTPLQALRATGRPVREDFHRHHDVHAHEPLLPRPHQAVRRGAMVGKGGFLQDTVEAMKEYGGVYLAIVGGAAALETMQIEEIEQVWWEDLMPECLWKFRVKNFGPLIVAIDAHGHSLYKDIKAQAAERIKAMNL